MIRKDAERLLPLVNSKEYMGYINIYVEIRINALKESLSTCHIDEVKRLQGAIEELRRFKTLRDEVLNPKD